MSRKQKTCQVRVICLTTAFIHRGRWQKCRMRQTRTFGPQLNSWALLSIRLTYRVLQPTSLRRNCLNAFCLAALHQPAIVYSIHQKSTACSLFSLIILHKSTYNTCHLWSKLIVFNVAYLENKWALQIHWNQYIYIYIYNIYSHSWKENPCKLYFRPYSQGSLSSTVSHLAITDVHVKPYWFWVLVMLIFKP